MAIALRGSGAAVKAANGNVTVPVHASTTSGDIMWCEVVGGDNVVLGFPNGAAEFRAAGAKSTAVGVVTVSAPIGIATGDLEILVAGTIAGGSVSITTDGGSAWTALGSQDVTAGEKLYAWYRIRQAGDGNPAVTPGSDHVVACRLAYKAGTFDTTTPIDNWTVSSEATSDTSFSWAPGFSTSVDNCLVAVVSTSGFDSNTAQVPVCTNAALASLTSRANHETLNGGGGGYGVTDGYLATAGTVGTFACTYANASPKAYAAFAIRPDPAATAWTVEAGATGNNGTGLRLTNAWKRAGASEGSFVVTHSGGNGIVARCHSFSGCKATGSPVGAISTIKADSGAGTTGTPASNSLTPAAGTSAILMLTGFSSGGTSGGGANNFASWSGTDPTFTEIGDDNSSLGTREAGAGCAWGLSNTGAATGSRTVALSVMDGTGGWVALTSLVELLPAGGSTVTIACAIAGLAALAEPVKVERKVVVAIAGQAAVAAPVRRERKVAAAIAGLAAVAPVLTPVKLIRSTFAGQAALAVPLKDTRKILVAIAGSGTFLTAVTVTSAGSVTTIAAAIAGGASVTTPVKETRKVAVTITSSASILSQVRDERKVAAAIAGVASVAPRTIPVKLIASTIAGQAAVAVAVKRNERAQVAVAGAATVSVARVVELERLVVQILGMAAIQFGVSVNEASPTVERLRTIVGAGQ